MNRASFQRLHEEFLEVEGDLLGTKRDEYAEPEGDVLQNFYVIAQLTDLTPAQIAGNYLAKHVQSILKQVYRDDFAWTWTTQHGEGEGLKQRIADARNYLLLLAACLEEAAEGDREEMQQSVDEYLDHDPVVAMFAGMSDLDRARLLDVGINPGESSRDATIRVMKEKT